jgi:ketosteroid isomerase-like protein
MASSREIIGRMHEVYFSPSWPKAIDFYGDDATYISYLPVELFPNRGERRGKAEILETFRFIRERYREMTAETLMSASEGDVTAILLLVRGLLRENGRVVAVHVADFIRLKDGLIINQRQVFDSFDLAQQVLDREISLR